MDPPVTIFLIIFLVVAISIAITGVVTLCSRRQRLAADVSGERGGTELVSMDC
jgi:hypothetical protein